MKAVRAVVNVVHVAPSPTAVWKETKVQDFKKSVSKRLMLVFSIRAEAVISSAGDFMSYGCKSLGLS